MYSKDISIINFHYAWPEAAELNYHYNKVLGFDESGFAGSGDQVYRRQAWQFMLSGGGLFNSLDYSFFVGHEDGLGENSAPGGGSNTLRFQLKTLSEFLHGFDLSKLHPNLSCINSSPGLIPYVLSDANHAIVWKYDQNCSYTPCPILMDGLIYFLKTNNGYLSCLDARDGTEYYSSVRLEGIKNIFTSPVGVKDRIYIAGTNGSFSVVKLGKEFELLAENTLDDSFIASPVILGNDLFLRGVKALYCIATP